MTFTVLYPDAAFAGAPEIETTVLTETGSITVFRARAACEVPDAAWASADAVVCYDAFPIDRAVVGKLGRCRILVRAGVGVDHIDLEACRAAGVPVCNTPDYGTTDVADHAMGLVLALARGILGYDRELGRHGPAGWSFARTPPPLRLAGRVLGIVGLGRIGIATALRAKAFGMRVAFHDPYVPSGLDRALGVEQADRLEALLSRADVLSLHVPLTAETRGLIDAAALAAMKPTALLVNTSRGAVLDTAALLAALQAGRLAGAALDVLSVEPPSDADPLFAAWCADAGGLRDRLILTPHAAFYSAESLIDLRRKSAEVVRDCLRDGRLRNRVDGGPPRLS